MAQPAGDKSTLNEARSASTRGPVLRDWAGIEDHLIKYDGGRVTGYSEDIDTLLVFAGLFSAILSAFVVQTYQLLQPDNLDATNRLLAYGFSAQRAQVPISAAINATMNSFLDSPPFIPSASARWINSLFFISLVLSLAAALLGILAKQWIREYMQWNSPLAAPRENVLVRQMRFEAWEAWNVAATISAVPALLEVAMILFLVGMIILLWTLDDVVAICVTAATAAFLLVVSAFTILPVLFHRCPYRSPTAWACVTGYNLLCTQLHNCVELSKLSFRALKFRIKQLCKAALDSYGGADDHHQRPYIRSRSSSYSRPSWHSPLDSILRAFLLHLWNAVKDWERPKTSPKFRVNALVWPSGLTDWRYRDLESCKAAKLQVGRWWTKSYDARPDAKRALATEWSELGENGQFLKQRESEKVPETVVDALFVEISHTVLLLQALSWVQRSSQDARVGTFIEQCTELVHISEPAGTTPYAIRMVATWCVLASLKHNQLHQPQLALLPRASSGLREDSPVTGLRLSTGVHIGDLLAPAPRQHKRELSMDASAPGSHIIPVLARMVAADLKYTLSAASGPGALPQERRTLELFNVLQALTESITDLRREPWFVQAVENVLRASTEGSATPKLAVMFPVACRQVKFTSQGKELAVTSGQTSPTDYESLILYYFERRLENPSEQTLNMFVFSCVRWLRERRISDVHSPVATTVLQRMGAAARVIAQLRAPRDVHGYDGADDGEWIKLVRHQYKDLAAEKARARVLRQLFHAFETAYRRGVLAGHQGLIRDMIHEGLKHTHEDLGNICTDRKCPWVKHKCQGEQALLPTFQNCPLLQKDVRVAPNSVPAKPSMSLIEQKRPVEVVIPPGAVDSVTSGTVRFLPADDLRLPLLHQALSTCKITYDRLDNCLALSPGSTSAKSLEKLLLEYFPGAAERYSEESINMFILTAVRWLDTQRKIEHRASATVTDILGRMVLVAEAVRQRERRSVYGCDEAEDYTWLAALLSYRERLVRTHGSIFRRLLHVFEDSFRRGVLVGPETWIAFYLHGCLESGHEGLSVCEDESCCWIRHECSDGLWKRDCALLHPIDSARGQNAPPAKTGSLSVGADSSTSARKPSGPPETAVHHEEEQDPYLLPSTKGWKFWAFYHACTSSRLTVRAQDNKIVLTSGVTTGMDYESLILRYFPSTFKVSDAIELSAFVLMVHRWLEYGTLFETPRDSTAAVLEKLAIFANDILSKGFRRRFFSCGEATDASWIRGICAYDGLFSHYHGSIYRRLLHAIEDMYRQKLLVGDDVADIPKILHGSLEVAHIDLAECENRGCPWVSHNECGDVDQCVLLGGRSRTSRVREPVAEEQGEDGEQDEQRPVVFVNPILSGAELGLFGPSTSPPPSPEVSEDPLVSLLVPDEAYSTGLFGPRSPQFVHMDLDSPSRPGPSGSQQEPAAQHPTNEDTLATDLPVTELDSLAEDPTADVTAAYQHSGQREPVPSGADVETAKPASTVDPDMRDPPSIIDDSHVILPSEAAAAGSSTESAELPAGDVEPASSLATGLSASATSASSAVPENDKAPLEARIDQPTSEANVQSEIALTAAPEEPDGPTNLNERGDRPARAAAHADAVPSFESPDVSALFETANAEGGAIQEQLPPLEGLPLPVIGSPYLPTPPLSAYVDRPDPLSMLASGRPPSTKGSDNDSAAAGGLPENRAVTPFVSEPPPGDSSAGEPFQESHAEREDISLREG